MTQEEVIAMAQEAEIYVVRPDEFQSVCIDDLTRFAKLVRHDVFNKHTHLWLNRIDEAVKAEREQIIKENAPVIASINKHLKEAVLAEREACADIADSMDACQDGAIGKAIRARR